MGRRAFPREHMAHWRQSRSEISPPTPGADDTPYIQFAIDQLTRDEELLGRSRDGVYSQDVAPIYGEEMATPEDVLNGEPTRQSVRTVMSRRTGTPAANPVDIDPLSRRTGASTFSSSEENLC